MATCKGGTREGRSTLVITAVTLASGSPGLVPAGAVLIAAAVDCGYRDVPTMVSVAA